jgi:hypothetical protein
MRDEKNKKEESVGIMGAMTRVFTKTAKIEIHEGPADRHGPLSDANLQLYETARDLKEGLDGVEAVGSEKSMWLCISKLKRDVADDRWTSNVYALAIEGFGVWLQHHFEKNGAYTQATDVIPGARLARDENGELYPVVDGNGVGTVEKRRE